MEGIKWDWRFIEDEQGYRMLPLPEVLNPDYYPVEYRDDPDKILACIWVAGREMGYAGKPDHPTPAEWSPNTRLAWAKGWAVGQQLRAEGF